MKAGTGIISKIKHWWLFLLRGIGFIAVGIYMLSYPVSGYTALSFVFGLVVIVAGAFELIHSYANRYHVGQVYRFFIGFIDLLIGIILITHLIVSMTVLPIVLGIWFLFRAASMFSFASLVHRPVWILLGGIIIVIFALPVMFNPAFGAMTIVLWTSFAFIITGIFNILLSFRLKAANDILAV